MKKLLLSIVFVALFALVGKAQQFITSYGFELDWNVPTTVKHVVYHDYVGYNMVHANRFQNRGWWYYDFVLQRGNVFIEVSVRNDGFVSRRVTRYDSPLFDHVCGISCGYNAVYYRAHNNGCGGHVHHGHNHVVVYNNNYSSGHHYNSQDANDQLNNRRSIDSRRRSNNVTYNRRDKYQDTQKSRRSVSRTEYRDRNNVRSRNSGD